MGQRLRNDILMGLVGQSLNGPVHRADAQFLFHRRIGQLFFPAVNGYRTVQPDAQGLVQVFPHPWLVEPAGGNASAVIGESTGDPAPLTETRQLCLALPDQIEGEPLALTGFGNKAAGAGISVFGGYCI